MKKRINKIPNEFELDLAPLLAVMVKLVPVLLLSTAFVQLNVIKTNFGSKDGIANTKTPIKFELYINILQNKSILINSKINGIENREVINSVNNLYDIASIQSSLKKIKTLNPSEKKINLIPDNTIEQKDIILIIDTIKSLQITESGPKKSEIELFPEIGLIR